MTRLPHKGKKKVGAKDSVAKPLSNDELMRFLKRLSSTYRDKRTGNSALADGLLRVADMLKEADSGEKPALVASRQQPELRFETTQPLETLEPDDITRFVRDSTKTKAQLIELAVVRFGIPRSLLSSQTSERVRQALTSAVQHEASIATIGAEAERYGARRRS